MPKKRWQKPERQAIKQLQLISGQSSHKILAITEKYKSESFSSFWDLIDMKVNQDGVKQPKELIEEFKEKSVKIKQMNISPINLSKRKHKVLIAAVQTEAVSQIKMRRHKDKKNRNNICSERIYRNKLIIELIKVIPRYPTSELNTTVFNVKTVTGALPEKSVRVPNQM